MPRRRVVVVGPPRRCGLPVGTLAVGAVAGAAIAKSGSKKQQSHDTTETVVNVHVDGLPQNAQMQPGQQPGHYPPQPITYAPPQPNYHQNYYPPPNNQPPPPVAYPPSGAAYPPTQPPSGVPPTNQGHPPPPYGWN